MINIRDSHQYLIGLFKFEGADAGHKLLAPLLTQLTFNSGKTVHLFSSTNGNLYVHTNIWASDFKRFQFFEIS